MSYQDEHTTAADKTRAGIESENRAIRAAHNELKALCDSLRGCDMADTHDISLSEGERALELMRALVAKLAPATKEKEGNHG